MPPGRAIQMSSPTHQRLVLGIVCESCVTIIMRNLDVRFLTRLYGSFIRCDVIVVLQLWLGHHGNQ